MDKIIIKIAEYFFNKWKKEKLVDGYHLPDLCPKFEKNYEKEDDIKNADLIHCNKCNSDLTDFDKISNYLMDKYINEAKQLFDDFEKIGLTIDLK